MKVVGFAGQADEKFSLQGGGNAKAGRHCMQAVWKIWLTTEMTPCRYTQTSLQQAHKKMIIPLYDRAFNLAHRLPRLMRSRESTLHHRTALSEDQIQRELAGDDD